MKILKVDFQPGKQVQEKHLIKDLVLPILIWAGLIILFLNVKHLPFEFSDRGDLVFKRGIKVFSFILLPLLLINLFNKDKSFFGIHFPKFSESFKAAFTAYMVLGPACMSFLIIGLLGWSYTDWPGAIILTIAFSIASYFVPEVTKDLPNKASLSTPNNSIYFWVLFSVATLLVTYVTFDSAPIISNVLYYVFIVGLGEELLFRGFIQSSFNQYFGKSFSIGNVKFGWGLVFAAAMFGLMHALVTVPPTWPWALWTFVMGLALGFIREKDGSILAAVILHAMLDMPIVFVSL